MWKWKWAFLFVFIASAIVAVALEQHYAREKYHAQREADCISLSISPAEKHDCAKEAQATKDYAPWWNVLLAWPEGITTWAIIVTFVFIGWQAEETRKAADAALEGVKVAQRSIDITILKERPRIRVEIEKLQFIQSGGPWPGYKTLPSVLLHIYNFGGTRAFPVDSRVELIVHGLKHAIPLLAVAAIDPTEDTPIHVSVRIMEEAPEDTIWLLNTEQTSASIFGTIRYTDVYENERPTTFRYQWVSDFAGIEMDQVGDKVLYGQWEKAGKKEDNEAN